MSEKKKPEHRVQVSARVTLTIEVMADEAWPSNVEFDYIYADAVRNVEGRVRELMKGRATIVGKPKVAAILIENKD